MSFTFDYRLYPSGQASVTDYIAGSNATVATVSAPLRHAHTCVLP
jgi:hypothetical protein